VAFGFGLLHLQPCVFPMIRHYVLLPEPPVLRRGEQLVQALIFCLFIVVPFSPASLAITAIWVPFVIVDARLILGSTPSSLSVHRLCLILLEAFESPSFVDLTPLNNRPPGRIPRQPASWA